MIARLKRFFGKEPEEAPGSYRPEEMQIYRYWNGTRTVAADPVALYKRVMDVGPELAVDMKVSVSPLKDAGAAYEKMVAKIRGIFNLPPLKDGIEVDGTLSDAAAASLLDDFLGWCEQLKKNLSPTPTSAEATSPSTASTREDGPPTSNTSASGSTASEPSTAPPSPSPTEPASPSEASTPDSTSTGP